MQMGRKQNFQVIFRLFTVCFVRMCEMKNMTQQDACRVLEFIETIEGRALRGHVFKKLALENKDNCQLNCYVENDCVSYNLGPLVHGKYACELSDSDDGQYPQDLVPRHGFLYVATKNSCSKSACASTGKCQSGFTDNGYRCKCQSGFVGEKCEQGTWLRINTNPICFGTRNEDYGSFIVAQGGSISALKLVHISGSLFCFAHSTISYWGCPSNIYGNKTLLTVITYVNHTVFLPNGHTAMMGDPGKGCASEYSYRLLGFVGHSSELVFNTTTSGAIPVAVNQEFQIWYGQDLADCSEFNNSGRSCVDVYFWFNSTY